MDFDLNYYSYMDRYYMEGKRKPFYAVFPAHDIAAEEAEYEKDSRKMQELCSENIRKVQDHVMDVCDKMEYEGSMMFDEYPDRCMFRMFCRQLYCNISGTEPEGIEYEKTALYVAICILLSTEMYRRRCRYRRCKCRYLQSEFNSF